MLREEAGENEGTKVLITLLSRACGQDTFVLKLFPSRKWHRAAEGTENRQCRL